MSYVKKRRTMSSLDALLKATATGKEETNAIDKALNTPTDRIMKATLEFEKAHTIKSSDSSTVEKFTVLKATIEDELEAARKLKEMGVTPTGRRCNVDPIPPADRKVQKIHRKQKMM